MNQLVAMAPLMTECFLNVPNYQPFTHLVPEVAINEMNPEKKDMKSKAEARLAPKTEKLDFSKPDLIDKEALLFSKYVWATIHGDKPFPSQYFGAHGKGLKKLGLKYCSIVVVPNFSSVSICSLASSIAFSCERPRLEKSSFCP